MKNVILDRIVRDIEGWQVWSAISPDQKPFRVVGELHCRPGDEVDLVGSFVDHPKYGRQFQATGARRRMPREASSIRRYLMSIEGIGSITAFAIVNKWGKHALAVIEGGAPDILAEISSIPAKKREGIHAAICERTAIDAASIALDEIGLKPSTAKAVIKKWGAGNAVARVKENPFRLTKLHRVGFKKADEVAARLGLSQHHPYRIEAGLIHVLEEAASRDGHVCLPDNLLPIRARKLLGVDRAEIDKVSAELISDGELVRFEGYVYLGWTARKEQHLAEWIREHMAADVPPIEPLTAKQCGMDITLDESQVAAVGMALREPASIVTGGPGTGKTTLTKIVYESMKRQGLHIGLASPTGKAASRLEEATDEDAMTMHRMLVVMRDENEERWEFLHDEDNPLDFDAIIVDETSMLGLSFAWDFFQAIPHGCRVILIGDPDQLPSVQAGRVLHDLIESGMMPVARLAQIHRQENERSLITENAHLINAGRMPFSGTDPGRDDFFVSLCDDPEAAQNLIVECVTRKIPAVFGIPANDIQVLSPMKKGPLGVEALNMRLQAALNPAGRRILNGRFRYRDPVIQLQNNYNLDVMNGMTGTMLLPAVDEDGDEVYPVDFGGEGPVHLERSNIRKIDLAYALTIHKYQGSEARCVIVVLHDEHYIMLRRDLLYTGITRGRELVLLVGTEKAIRQACRVTGGRTRFSNLKTRLTKETR